ncbi:MAG: HNH endonuclease [Nitrospinae bacterium]|nr:HNH endonuclease [Nitrospinota bacterium]
MPRIYITVETQRTVIERAHHCCEYCQSRADYATAPFAVEHIVPISRGGTSELSNLALSCSGCGHKYNRTEAPDPTDGIPTTFFNPRQQRWHEHFCWTEDYTHIIGLTPTGRATVEALRLNRAGLVNMRQVLYEIGRHPPDLPEV